MPTQKPTPSSNDSDPEEEPFLPSADEAIDLVKASGFAFPPNTHPTLLSQIPESNPGYVAEMRESSNILGLGPSEDVGEVFKAIILIIPFSFLYLAMDIMIHLQYAQQPTWSDEFWRVLNVLPALSIGIFYSNRYISHPLLQASLTAISIACGTRLIYVINRSGYLVIMQQAPPLSTIWVFAITQLDIWLAIGSLAVVWGWKWWEGLQIVFA